MTISPCEEGKTRSSKKLIEAAGISGLSASVASASAST